MPKTELKTLEQMGECYVNAIKAYLNDRREEGNLPKSISFELVAFEEGMDKGSLMVQFSHSFEPENVQ